MKHIQRLVIVMVMMFTSTALADEEGLATFKIMKPAVALKLAQATLEACRAEGYQVAVAVVDRFGIIQVILRDQLAGAHTPETARRKAWTAASFKTDTITMMQETQSGKVQSGVRFIPDTLMAGGGVPVDAGGTIVGAVGVSGGPGGEADQKCADKGIRSIEELLMF